MISHTRNHEQPDDSLRFCLALMRLMGRIYRRMDGKLGALHGLSFVDFAVLLELSLHPHGKMRRVDLAETLSLTQSAITRILIPLEKIGVIKRESDPHDARVGYAAITAAGRRICRESLDTANDLAGDIRAMYSSDVAALKSLA